MTSYHLGPLLGFDLETTAPDPFEARIVTASVVYQGAPDEEPISTNWILNPGVDIPQEAANIHGITTERAQAEGADPAVALAEIVETIADHMAAGLPVVAYNAAYDFTVLEADLSRHGITSLGSRLEGPVSPIIDPFVIDKQADPYRKGKRTLAVTSAHYGVHLNNAHNADADALAALHLARLIPQQEPRLQMPAAKIHEWTITWRAKQAASLQDYFRRTKPGVIVNGEWPIQTPSRAA